DSTLGAFAHRSPQVRFTGPGVYVIFMGDERALYAGQSKTPLLRVQGYILNDRDQSPVERAIQRQLFDCYQWRVELWTFKECLDHLSPHIQTERYGDRRAPMVLVRHDQGFQHSFSARTDTKGGSLEARLAEWDRIIHYRPILNVVGAP